jgi:peptidoglycan/LPS O-acetylase OafA/YrhL
MEIPAKEVTPKMINPLKLLKAWREGAGRNACTAISPEASVSLDWVRGVAALAVLLGHVRAFVFAPYSGATHFKLAFAPFYILTMLGHQAVIVFFVLSGFLVGGGLLQRVTGGKEVALVPFGIARFSRIYTVLIPALILTALCDRIGLGLFGSTALYVGKAYPYVLSFNVASNRGLMAVAANILCLQTIVAPCYGSNGPLWSIAYEWWYYWLFPLMLVLLVKGSPGGRHWPALALWPW